ncbi:MAG: ribonuclease HII [Oscillospiraceae bacterium]|nr:ribonuclease HII [Oscillospiraceae bacterium]
MNDLSKGGLFGYDSDIRAQYGAVCGIDEAGRGPLAGDVYAAAVIFDEGTVIEGINDSKKLTEKKRELLFDEICEKAKAYCIATASIAEIEEINILNAAMLAMKRAYEGLGMKSDMILVDGNKLPPIDGNVRTVVKGDATSASIAAASILAKVARDRYMDELAAQYPEYGFEKHKGYGTKAHYEAVDRYGLCPVHRPSFFKKYYAQKNG